MKKTIITGICLIMLSVFAHSQNDSLNQLKFKSLVFGNIFTAFYYSPGEKIKPDKGFEFTTGLIGYKAQWGDKATATLIYDVFRTTDRIMVSDSNNYQHNVSYTRGSDYTGFLKMAQIDFMLSKSIEFSVGQILNQQYLTFQDKFWGFRYIATTFQEMNRFGAQADFGARFTFKPISSLNFSIGAVNGEGPFRLQSDDGSLQYFTNIEYSPFKGYIIKVFGDYLPVSGKETRNTISFFTGYKNDKWRLGTEINILNNHLNTDSNDLKGLSTYGAYRLNPKWQLLLRHDYIIKSMIFENTHLFIAGAEFEPYKGFYTSINYRFRSHGNVSWIYFSFGARF